MACATAQHPVHWAARAGQRPTMEQRAARRRPFFRGRVAGEDRGNARVTAILLTRYRGRFRGWFVGSRVSSSRI